MSFSAELVLSWISCTAETIDKLDFDFGGMFANISTKKKLKQVSAEEFNFLGIVYCMSLIQFNPICIKNLDFLKIVSPTGADTDLILPQRLSDYAIEGLDASTFR